MILIPGVRLACNGWDGPSFLSLAITEKFHFCTFFLLPRIYSVPVMNLFPQLLQMGAKLLNHPHLLLAKHFTNTKAAWILTSFFKLEFCPLCSKEKVMKAVLWRPKCRRQQLYLYLYKKLYIYIFYK